MNIGQKNPHPIVHNPAYRHAFQRLDEALAGERKRDQANWDLAEDQRLTRARLALFGSAPK